MSLTIQPSTVTSTTAPGRNVRCLIVGEDLGLGDGSFALTVDEDMTVEQLQQHVLQHLPSGSQERIGSELQLFKGFDLYTSDLASTSTPTKKTTKRSSISPIDELLQTETPEKTASKYFQRKYAMRKRASLGEYLPRGRKCERSRIDVLVSVPKFQLSEDLAELETEPESESDDLSLDFGFESSDVDAEDSESQATPLKKRKRDPVVDESAAGGATTPTKWQRAPCGRVVSVDTLRMRSSCARCLSFKQTN